jgi:hypothetical protein
MPLEKERTIFPRFGVKARIEDEGGGPYLVLEAHNCGQVENENAIYLNNHKEIDQLAAELHKLLKQAEGAAGPR